MRRVADQREAVAHETLRQGQVQRIGEPLARQPDVAQEIAEARAQRVEIGVIVQRVDARGFRIAFGPDDGRPVARQRQDRQRPRRHEELVRDTAMRLVVFDRADQRRLAIAPARPLDPGAAGGAALPSVGPDQKAAPDRVSALQGQLDCLTRDFLCDHAGARQLGDPCVFPHRIQERAPQVPVFDHIAHRAFLDLGMVEMHQEGRRPFARAPVGHLDFQHRLGVIRDPVPDADGRQKPLRRQRQRVGPPVEAVVAARVLVQRVDHGHAEPRLRQGQGQGRTVQPAAHDQDIALRCHGPQYGHWSGIVHARSCR